MTEVDPDNKIDASPELLSGHHSHHEHHQHHKHKRACVPRLEAVTSAELGLIRKMMTVHEPDKLGTGRDVVSREGERSGYNALEVVAAWKVDPKAKPMQAYIRLRNKLNSARSSGDHWVPTALDAAVTQSRQNGLLGDNEYWMLHGGIADHMEGELCHGATFPGPGAFGEGVYMADEADKMDQYVQLDSGANHLKAVLEQPLDDNVNAALERQGGLYLAYVMRAYLGLRAEVQVHRQHESSSWYWFDPQSERTEVVEREGHLGLNSEKPPFQSTFDSVKVMCSHHNKDFKHRFPNDFHGDFPRRFNEYLVESSERLAIQYIIAYERVNK